MRDDRLEEKWKVNTYPKLNTKEEKNYEKGQIEVIFGGTVGRMYQSKADDVIG